MNFEADAIKKNDSIDLLHSDVDPKDSHTDIDIISLFVLVICIRRKTQNGLSWDSRFSTSSEKKSVTFSFYGDWSSIRVYRITNLFSLIYRFFCSDFCGDSNRGFSWSANRARLPSNMPMLSNSLWLYESS